MAKKQKPSSEELLSELIKIHVPQAYLAHFDLVEVKDKPDCYELVLHEGGPSARSVKRQRGSIGWFLQSDKYPYSELFT
jgi:hypothetical protein